MVIFAVVRVPVLSEQRMLIEATSWRAGTLVTTARWVVARSLIPIAMVTCITIGSAIGMDATRIAREFTIKRAVRSSWDVNWARRRPCTINWTKTNMDEMIMIM
jgi:hypothetical protein